MSNELDKQSFTELKKIATKMGLRHRRSRTQMILDIQEAFKEYEEYKKEKLDVYTRHEQLGNKGKEGITYLVSNKKGEQFAMKTFRKSKSSKTLEQEYILQKKASEKGISPAVYDFDTVSKYIVMEKMDKHMVEYINKRHGVLYKYHQLRILEIFKILDEIGIFHNDSNLYNYMLKDKKLYIIDYGYSREINDRFIRKYGMKNPNMTLSLAMFIIKLKEMNVPEKSYKYLLRALPTELVKKYKLA